MNKTTKNKSTHKDANKVAVIYCGGCSFEKLKNPRLQSPKNRGESAKSVMYQLDYLLERCTSAERRQILKAPGILAVSGCEFHCTMTFCQEMFVEAEAIDTSVFTSQGRLAGHIESKVNAILEELLEQDQRSTIETKPPAELSLFRQENPREQKRSREKQAPQSKGTKATQNLSVKKAVNPVLDLRGLREERLYSILSSNEHLIEFNEYLTVISDLANFPHLLDNWCEQQDLNIRSCFYEEGAYYAQVQNGDRTKISHLTPGSNPAFSAMHKRHPEQTPSHPEIAIQTTTKSGQHPDLSHSAPPEIHYADSGAYLPYELPSHDYPGSGGRFDFGVEDLSEKWSPSTEELESTLTNTSDNVEHPLKELSRAFELERKVDTGEEASYFERGLSSGEIPEFNFTPKMPQRAIQQIRTAPEKKGDFDSFYKLKEQSRQKSSRTKETMLNRVVTARSVTELVDAPKKKAHTAPPKKRQRPAPSIETDATIKMPVLAFSSDDRRQRVPVPGRNDLLEEMVFAEEELSKK